MIEKHFTLRRADGGVDSAFSMEPEEMQALVVETKRAWEALGCINYGSTEAEKKSRLFRRSLYIVKDLKAGDALTPGNVRALRPGFGLPPKFLEQVTGMTVRSDVKRGTAVTWQLFG